MKPRYLLALLIAPVIAHAQLNIPGLLQNATSAARQSMHEQQEQQLYNDMETQKAQRQQQLQQARQDERARNAQLAQERQQARAESKRRARANNPRCQGKDDNCKHYLEYHVTCANCAKDDLDRLEYGWRNTQAKAASEEREYQEGLAQVAAVCPEITSTKHNDGEKIVLCHNRGVRYDLLPVPFSRLDVASQTIAMKTIEIVYAHNVRDPRKGLPIMNYVRSCMLGSCGPSPL
ncbi:hypothetical protein [Ralstonia insidiosa]|uniref:hypothetical protein n=1 Tax=Ralstonia insidiosa TaxID=190721 RepID=UPI000CEEAA61|nr:hypothetical protein [Ralstonia insidiosa]